MNLRIIETFHWIRFLPPEVLVVKVPNYHTLLNIAFFVLVFELFCAKVSLCNKKNIQQIAPSKLAVLSETVLHGASMLGRHQVLIGSRYTVQKYEGFSKRRYLARMEVQSYLLSLTNLFTQSFSLIDYQRPTGWLSSALPQLFLSLVYWSISVFTSLRQPNVTALKFGLPLTMHGRQLALLIQQSWIEARQMSQSCKQMYFESLWVVFCTFQLCFWISSPYSVPFTSRIWSAISEPLLHSIPLM